MEWQVLAGWFPESRGAVVSSGGDRNWHAGCMYMPEEGVKVNQGVDETLRGGDWWAIVLSGMTARH